MTFGTSKTACYPAKLIVLLGLSASCGGPLNDAGSCRFQVESQDIIQQSGRQVVEMEGTLPTACETLTRENSGKLEVRIRLTGPEDESIVLGEVEAGSREKSFDPAIHSLRAGSLDAVFSSQTEPGWEAPWADRPTSFKLALFAPFETSQDALPRRAVVVLSL